MHGIYDQRCMLNYARRSGALHAWMRQTSADVYNHMQIELASKGRASYVHTFYKGKPRMIQAGLKRRRRKLTSFSYFYPARKMSEK
jgi:hypothetical protein